jgi:murein DD-endopeptidase MepM/ murein hydrolase activator NlpD
MGQASYCPKPVFSLCTVVLAVGVLLSACGSNRAPVIFGEGASAHSDGLPVPRRKPPPYTVRVVRGDTLYSIARRNNADLRAVIDENNFHPPYRLLPGQAVRIPRPRYHVVRRGDTIFGISRQYDVEMSKLTAANQIRAPFLIRPGDRLMLPYVPAPPSRMAAAPPQPQPKPQPQVQTPPRTSAAPAAEPRAEPAQQEPRRPVTLRPAGPRPSRLIWPVDGRVVSTFGPKEGGLHNDGVNIAVPEGTPVRAAADGVVVYHGNELRSYGNMILIRHAGGLITAYAHNSTLKVVSGQQVRQGDVIALAGATGNVPTPQVHFEVREGSKAVNPVKYLPSG